MADNLIRSSSLCLCCIDVPFSTCCSLFLNLLCFCSSGHTGAAQSFLPENTLFCCYVWGQTQLANVNIIKKGGGTCCFCFWWSGCLCVFVSGYLCVVVCHRGGRNVLLPAAELLGQWSGRGNMFWTFFTKKLVLSGSSLFGCVMTVRVFSLGLLSKKSHL